MTFQLFILHFLSFPGKKKRSKEQRDSFCSGGTWPRTRGGPIIEHGKFYFHEIFLWYYFRVIISCLFTFFLSLGTGTILHPQKMKKGRLPLAELLANLPKYPPEGKMHFYLFIIRDESFDGKF